jgi:hypothetical protein
MGERHQVYVVTQRNFYEPATAANTRVWGIHHQWLYGRSAVQQMLKMITGLQACYTPPMNYAGATPSFGSLMMRDNAVGNFLMATYSIDPDGSYCLVHNLEGEDSISDPRLGDNNQGITVIDARDFTSIKYGFCMLCNDTKREVRDKYDAQAMAFVPLDAMGYMQRTYPFNPKSYWRTKKEGDKRTDKERGRDIGQTVAEMRVLANKCAGYPLLTKADIVGIWPSLKKKSNQKVWE